MTRALKFLTLAAITISCTAIGQITSGEITAMEASGDWASFAISHGDDARFRAAFVSTPVSMYIDSMVPTCNIIVSFNFPFSRPSDTDIAGGPTVLITRIDTADPQTVNAVLSPVAMGDDSYIVDVFDKQEIGKVIAGIGKANTLRIKQVLSTGKAFYYAVSLHGVAEAFDRSSRGCDRYKTSLSPGKPPAPTHERPSDTAKFF